MNQTLGPKYFIILYISTLQIHEIQVSCVNVSLKKTKKLFPLQERGPYYFAIVLRPQFLNLEFYLDLLEYTSVKTVILDKIDF